MGFIKTMKNIQYVASLVGTLVLFLATLSIMYMVMHPRIDPEQATIKR
jgi:hypothetical protein